MVDKSQWPSELLDDVERPSHYCRNGIEFQDVADAFHGGCPDLWNATKYLLRAPYKCDEEKDLLKCINRIERHLSKIRSAKAAKK